jgi:hypothetical protein
MLPTKATSFIMMAYIQAHATKPGGGGGVLGSNLDVTSNTNFGGFWGPGLGGFLHPGKGFFSTQPPSPHTTTSPFKFFGGLQRAHPPLLMAP